MWHRNNGKEEAEVVQNQWTAYLVKAIKRRRNDYIEQISKENKDDCAEIIGFSPLILQGPADFGT